VKYASEVSQLTERMERLQALAKDWDATGTKRLKEVEKILETGKYAVDEQKQLQSIRTRNFYDTSAHDEASTGKQLRSVETHLNYLKKCKQIRVNQI
jgi:hypothetical protein